MSRLLNGLNPSQRKAVTHTNGPLLIIAGPGSGKTRTVVHSIAYAIENLGVAPDRIVAFTFTRKATNELKDRLSEIVSPDIVEDIWISTFHSFCGHVSKTDFEKLDIDNTREFTVEELTHIYKERARSQIDYIQHHEFVDTKEIRNFILDCEMKRVSPEAASKHISRPQDSQMYLEIYKRYKQISEDGTDIYTKVQLYTNALFRDIPEVKVKWQEKFELIFVDEYQDTNPVQYQIIKSLAEKHRNLRVVGDDDQGIYGWRGANIQNILNFEKDFPNAEVISLGQNYRSTQKIVEVSRSLTDFIPDRRDKELFTRNLEGPTVKYFHCKDQEEEASVISDFIYRAIQEGRNPSDFAVLYRTNKQAYTFENTFDDLELPYYKVNESENLTSDQPEHVVSLMTIHKSKGLEFPNVFVVGICQGLLPEYHIQDEKDWDEELRVLYVAMTRAKNWLCLSSYEREGYRQRGQSPFIERGYIPTNLLESIDTLKHTPTPPVPEEMYISQAQSDTVESLPEKLLETDAIVLGIDPGVKNIGWSITQKLSDGYTVLDCNTQITEGWGETLKKTTEIINKLIASYSIDAIAIERLEGAKEDWFRFVAACVAKIQQIARYHGITEVCLYTPQQVKYAATGNRNADKTQVMQGVKERCNLVTIPNSDHAADAIAASLCYLRSYLNSSRFEGNKRKMERYETGCDYIDKRQFDEAIDEFKETLYIDPIFTDVYVSMGRAHLAQNKIQAAENAAEKALRLKDNIHPDSQKLLDAIKEYRSGCSSLKNREWNIAIDNFKESINQEPIFTEAHCGLSKAYLNAGNLEAARNAAEEALKLKNDYLAARDLLDAITAYHTGLNFYNDQLYCKAIDRFKETIDREPFFTEAHYFLGYVHFQNGAFEAAEQSINKTLDLNPNHQPTLKLLEDVKQAFYNHALNYFDNRQYGEAIEAFKDTINRFPKFTEAHCGLGRTYLRKGNLISTEISAREAIKLDDNYLPAQELLNELCHTYYKQGNEYLSKGNLSGAEKSARETIRLDKKYSLAYHLLQSICQEYYNQGHTNIMKGKQASYNHEDENKVFKFFDDAIRFLKKANDLSYNEEKRIYANLGRAYYWINKYDQAVNCYQKVVDLDSQDKNAHINLGNAYYWTGAYEDAIDPFKKAKKLNPNCAKTCYYIARIQFKLGYLGEAALEVKNALRVIPTYKVALELLEEIDEKIKLTGTDKMVLIPEDKFWIDKDSVTNAEYLKFVDSNPQWTKNNIKNDSDEDGDYLKDWDGNHYVIGKGDEPVVHVSWYAARAYAKWMEKRLPTAAKWRKAIGESDLWEWCLDEEAKVNLKESSVYVADIFWASPRCTRLPIGFRCARSSMEVNI